ncbi:hypothetical protein GCM10025858_38150 [Alicyclobacillus sacchari]|nr:hypothetical protein GCM10025858_38150 [Alicyclobacillus sacchari]
MSDPGSCETHIVLSLMKNGVDKTNNKSNLAMQIFTAKFPIDILEHNCQYMNTIQIKHWNCVLDEHRVTVFLVFPF